MKRLCFLSPDVAHTRQVVEDLRENGIPDKRIYVVAKDDIDLEDLPDSGPESNDFLPAYERGVAIGGVGGLLAGLFALTLPASGLVIGGGTVLLFGLYGAGLGGLLSGLAGASYPSSRLEHFEVQINEGKLLVMADVPGDQVDHYEALIKAIDPETEVMGLEPPAHFIP